MVESLAYDGIDTGTALADELVLAGGEVVVAGPAWGGVLVWDGDGDDARCGAGRELTSRQEIESIS